MRFVDPRARVGAAMLCIALTGCASLADWVPGLRSGGATASDASADTSAQKANAAVAAPPGAKGGVPGGAASRSAAPTAVAANGAVARDDASVNASVQRAFDAARRALAAGRLEDAERGFRALTMSNPELGGPYANLGLIYRRTGKLADSVSALEQATRLSPRQAMYFNELGISYRQSGQFEKARGAYESALALAPDDADAHLNLGILYDLYLWNADQAQRHYERYLALTPGGDQVVGKWVADLKNRKAKPAGDQTKEPS